MIVVVAYAIIGTVLLGAILWAAKDRGEEHKLASWQFKTVVIAACLLWPIAFIWATTTNDEGSIK